MYPKPLADEVIVYNVNWTYAAQLLESAGLYKKGNQWYLPNGTPLTLEIVTPSGWTDWVTFMSTVANELTEFGIPTKVIAVDTGVHYSGVLHGKPLKHGFHGLRVGAAFGWGGIGHGGLWVACTSGVLHTQ